MWAGGDSSNSATDPREATTTSQTTSTSQTKASGGWALERQRRQQRRPGFLCGTGAHGDGHLLLLLPHLHQQQHLLLLHLLLRE